MLESLSRLRKSVQKELDFINSISRRLSAEKLERALEEIDGFSAAIADFLAQLTHREDDELERSFRMLVDQHDALEHWIGGMLGP